MKSSRASRRSTLAAALVIAVAAVSAGCTSGGASSTPAPAATGTGGPTATPSRIPLATAQPGGGQPSLPPSIIACLRANGVPVASTSTNKQVRQAFVALPLAGQERVFTACEHLFPLAVRQTIANDLAQEKAMAK